MEPLSQTADSSVVEEGEVRDVKTLKKLDKFSIVIVIVKGN